MKPVRRVHGSSDAWRLFICRTSRAIAEMRTLSERLKGIECCRDYLSRVLSSIENHTDSVVEVGHYVRRKSKCNRGRQLLGRWSPSSRLDRKRPLSPMGASGMSAPGKHCPLRHPANSSLSQLHFNWRRAWAAASTLRVSMVVDGFGAQTRIISTSFHILKAFRPCPHYWQSPGRFCV